MISPTLQALAAPVDFDARTSTPVLFLLCGSELKCMPSEGLPVA
jgi:hypothetical protein